MYGDDYEEHPEPPASQKTISRLHALGARKGFDHAKIHDAAVKAYGVESTNDMTETQALKLIGVLEKKPDVASGNGKESAPASPAAALGRLRFTAEKRGLTDSDLLNMAGERYGVESLDELTPGTIADLESHVRNHYEERKGAAA